MSTTLKQTYLSSLQSCPSPTAPVLHISKCISRYKELEEVFCISIEEVSIDIKNTHSSLANKKPSSLVNIDKEKHVTLKFFVKNGDLQKLLDKGSI